MVLTSLLSETGGSARQTLLLPLLRQARPRRGSRGFQDVEGQLVGVAACLEGLGGGQSSLGS